MLAGLHACGVLENKEVIIFIPDEYRSIDAEDFWDKSLFNKFDEQESTNNLLKSSPKGIRISNHGYITNISWRAPFSLSGKKFSFGKYIFEVAKVRAMKIKIKDNQIVVSDDECFSYAKKKVSNVIFTFSRKVNMSNFKNIYFYKITSPLNDKPSIIKDNSFRISCVFITNLEFPKIDHEIKIRSTRENIFRPSLFVVNREYWFAPTDGGIPSDFYTHSVLDNWIRVPRESKSYIQNGVPLASCLL